jgi:hypothetical protein
MTRSEAEDIARAAARAAVEDVLERLGIDTKNAAETRIHALLTMVGVIVTGMAGAIWLAVKGGQH